MKRRGSHHSRESGKPDHSWMPGTRTGILIVITVATAVAAPANAQSPPVPRTPPEITLSCGMYGLTLGVVTYTASVRIWTSAHVLEWIGNPARNVFSAETPTARSIG
jgi:hypothetical protein